MRASSQHQAQIQTLIHELLQAARDQGLNQKMLGQRTGLGETQISRLKTAKDVRLSTLLLLADAVGQKLVLAPADPLVHDILNGNVL